MIVIVDLFPQRALKISEIKLWCLLHSIPAEEEEEKMHECCSQ